VIFWRVISWSALSVSTHNQVGHHKHLLEPEANRKNMYADRPNAYCGAAHSEAVNFFQLNTIPIALFLFDMTSQRCYDSDANTKKPGTLGPSAVATGRIKWKLETNV
jgi:hypothetical protein